MKNVLRGQSLVFISFVFFILPMVSYDSFDSTHCKIAVIREGYLLYFKHPQVTKVHFFVEKSLHAELEMRLHISSSTSMN